MPVYYLLWPLTERPGPLFAQQTRHIESGSLQSKDRRWTVQSVLETLMMQRRNTIGCHGVEFGSDMPPTAEQAMIPDLLRPVPGKEEKAAAA